MLTHVKVSHMTVQLLRVTRCKILPHVEVYIELHKTSHNVINS